MLPGGAGPGQGAMLRPQLAPVMNLMNSVVTSQIEVLKDSIFSQLRVVELRLSIQTQAVEQLFDSKMGSLEERIGVLEQQVMQLRVNEASMHDMFIARIAALEKRLSFLECVPPLPVMEEDPMFYSEGSAAMTSHSIEGIPIPFNAARPELGLQGSVSGTLGENMHLLAHRAPSPNEVQIVPPMPRSLSHDLSNVAAQDGNAYQTVVAQMRGGPELGREHMRGELPDLQARVPGFQVEDGLGPLPPGVFPSLQTHGPVFSVGSKDHLMGCKPCSFFCFSKRGCKKISSCEYCHMEHRARPRKRTTRVST